MDTGPGTLAPPYHQGIGTRYNTNYTRFFMGRDRQGSKYDPARLMERERDPDRIMAKLNISAACSTRLRIWDGGGPDEPYVRFLFDNFKYNILNILNNMYIFSLN